MSNLYFSILSLCNIMYNRSKNVLFIYTKFMLDKECGRESSGNAAGGCKTKFYCDCSSAADDDDDGSAAADTPMKSVRSRISDLCTRSVLMKLGISAVTH